MGSNLEATEIGVIELRVDGIKYVCSALGLTLRINEVPQATVTVGFGIGITGTGFQDPRPLMAKVRSRNGKLPKCEIYERLEWSNKEERCIFRGVMIAAAPVYRASGGGGSSAMIQVVCMHEACKLLTSPLSAYTLAAADTAVQAATNEEELAAIDNALMESLEDVDLHDTIDNLADVNPDLATGVNELVSAIVDKNSAKNGVASVNCDITKYIYSDYKVANVAGTTIEQYYTQLAGILVSSLRNGTIFDIFKSVLLSAEFMQVLLPKLPGESDKLELAPSRAWSSNVDLVLTEQDVFGISCSTNALDMLNTPQMFITYFEDPVSTTNPTVATSGGSDSIGGVFGVYSTDPTVTQALKTALKKESGSVNSVLSQMIIRCKTFRGPSWLTPFEPVTVGGDPVDTEQDKRTQDKTETAVESFKSQIAQRSDTKARKVADEISKALFSFIYGSQDTLSLTLNPKKRMGFNGGKLENNIGKVVRTKIKTELGGKETTIDLKGLLTSITYQRTSGIKSSISYTALLTRVRDGNDDLAVDCPLYIKR